MKGTKLISQASTTLIRFANKGVEFLYVNPL